MNPFDWSSWAVAFVWTLALELPIAAFVLRDRFDRRAFFLAFFAGNSLTHPIVWQLILRFENYRTGWLVMETFAVIGESAIYALGARFGRGSPRASIGRCFVAALAANAFSAGIGPSVLEWIDGTS